MLLTWRYPYKVTRYWKNIFFPWNLDCGNLTVVNGQFAARSGTTFGQTATLTCDTGYIIVGEEIVTCTESGIWNASAVTCALIGKCIIW